MLVGIVQSSFLPWRGFFDLLDDVDLMILFDDVAFSSKSWRSRNRIKTADGSVWISVPVQHAWPRKAIDETLIDKQQNWRAQLKGQIHAAYMKSPCYKTYGEPLFAILDQPYTTISELNQALIQWAADIMDIKTPVRQSRPLQATGNGEDRVLELLQKTGATVFLNGPSARAYSTPTRYQEAGIQLLFKTYGYPPYPQLHGAYDPQLSIIDLIFNCGEDARRYLKSQTASEPATT